MAVQLGGVSSQKGFILLELKGNVREEIRSIRHTLMNDDSIPKLLHHTISHGYKDNRRQDISALPLLQQKQNNCNAYDLYSTTYQLKVGKKNAWPGLR